MSDILAQVAANVDGARNAGNAVLYECVQVKGKRGEVKGASSMGQGHGLVAGTQAMRCCTSVCRYRFTFSSLSLQRMLLKKRNECAQVREGGRKAHGATSMGWEWARKGGVIGQ